MALDRAFLLWAPGLASGLGAYNMNVGKTDWEQRGRYFALGKAVTGDRAGPGPRQAGGALTVRLTAPRGLPLRGVGGRWPLAVAAVGMAADNQTAVSLPAHVLQLLRGRTRREPRVG